MPRYFKISKALRLEAKILLLEKSSFKYGGIDYIRGKRIKNRHFRYFCARYSTAHSILSVEST